MVCCVCILFLLMMLRLMINIVVFLVVLDDIQLLPLLPWDPVPVTVLLLPLVLSSSILEPDFYLNNNI